MQIELAAAKQLPHVKSETAYGPVEASLPPKLVNRDELQPSAPAPAIPAHAATLNMPSPLAFRAWPKFQPIIQLPAPLPQSRRQVHRWRMHRGRAAAILLSSALVFALLIGLTLAGPLWLPQRGIMVNAVAALPTTVATLPATKKPAALLAQPTVTRLSATVTRPNPTSTPKVPTTPDLAATLGAAVAATLTAQPTPTLPSPATPPAATAAVSPLPSPTSFMNQSALGGAAGVLFDETFKPGGYWDVGETPYAVREVVDGRFNIKMKTIGAISWSFNGISGDNFYVQAATTSDACRNGDYYGIVFRVRDDSNFYLYGISCDGRYRVLRQKDGVFTPLIDFRFSPAVTIDGGYNLLGVRAVNDQFSFYVNDELLASATDSTFAQGRFGVFAKSFETANLSIHFDDITAWTIKP